MCFMCIVELYVTVNYIKILSIVQKFSLEILGAGISEKYLSIPINCPIFLFDFN
jgi:hypothetical protein